MKFLMLFISISWSVMTFANTGMIEGKWLAENKSTEIMLNQVEPGVWLGVVTHSPMKPEMKGQQILSSIVKQPDGYKGKLYALKKAKYYDADIKVMEDTLEVEVKAGFFKKTMIWTRIE
jgi:uncharacterized protein (DUF2147 family)